MAKTVRKVEKKKGKTPVAWLKVLGSDGYPVANDWEAKEHGKHARRLGQSVMFARRPTARPGDRIVYYSVGVRRVFAEGKVVSEPYADPPREAYEGEDGRRYPYWVDVAVDASVPLVEDGVPLKAVSIAGRDLPLLVRRRGVLRLLPEEHAEIVRLLHEAAAAQG